MDRHNDGAVVPFERLQAARGVEFEAAEQQVAAPEGWQRYIGRHDGV